GTGVAGSNAGVGVHGQGKITVDEINLASADVVVHDLFRGGDEELLARGALKIAEDFHDNRGVLRAKGLGRIDVVDAVDGDGGEDRDRIGSLGLRRGLRLGGRILGLQILWGESGRKRTTERCEYQDRGKAKEKPADQGFLRIES